MVEQPVAFHSSGNIAIIELNRPERRNAITPQLSRELVAAVARFESAPDMQVGILTGRGPVFCAGADLSVVAEGSGEEMSDVSETFAGFVSMDRSKPLIAAVNGHAIAGGFELVLACDLAVASENAEFGLPEVTRGLVAVAGGSFRLPRYIGTRRATELILTGRRLTATDALAWGLVNRLAPPAEVMQAAIDLAGEIASNAPVAVRESLRLARMSDAVDVALWETARDTWARILRTRDAREGASAFVEKRAPRWHGE